MADIKKALGEFLANAEPIVETVVEPGPQTEVVAIAPAVGPLEAPDNQVITTVLADMKRVGMVAKDMHYHAYGKAFYGLHLLADLVDEIEGMTDDLFEAFFLGMKRGAPAEMPTMEEVYRLALDTLVLFPKDKNYWIAGLADICFKTMTDVEVAKKLPDLKAGVQAILDNISQKCLVAYGLLKKSCE